MRSSRIRSSIPVAFACLSLALAAPARADDAATCGSAYEQGQTLRAQHKLIAARQQLLLCAAASCSTATRNDCQQWLGEVQQLQPTVLFDVTDDAGHAVSAVRVTIDGAPLVDHLDGTSIPIDPGSHAFAFSADGMVAATVTYPVKESLKDQRVPVTMKSTASTSPTPPPASTAEPLPPAPSGSGDPNLSPDQTPARSSPLKTVGFITGGVGLAGIIVGSIFGGIAMSQNSDANCNAANVCDKPSSRTDAQGSANVSTVAFIVGGVALATGIVLVVVGSKKHSASAAHVEMAPMVGMGSGGLLLQGGF